MQDEAWKEIIEKLFPDFLAFFFPQIYQDIDFSKGFKFLDKELQKILKAGKTGKRIADKLVQVYLNDGSEKWLLIHIEIQGYRETNFSERVYTYNYLIFNQLKKETISLVLLTDKNANFRPNEYKISRWGFELRFRYPVIKLIDYQQKWPELERDSSAFSVVTQSFLKTIETCGQDRERYSWKKKFIIGLYESGLTHDIIFYLYQFIDLTMNLSVELERELNEIIDQIEEDKNMPIVTSAERIGMEKGLKKGEIKELHESIDDIWEIKFGEGVSVLHEQLKPIEDIEILRQIKRGLKQAKTSDEARNIILARIADWQKN